MNAKEKGFLLLTSSLGDPGRKPLTVPQFRTLTNRVRQMKKPEEDRDLSEKDLVTLGYDRRMAMRIMELLSDEERLTQYLRRGRKRDCVPVCRIHNDYPILVRKRLGLDAPGCLWAKGDISLLRYFAVALVGSRDLAETNRFFAETVGREAARQGLVLISGNARGADRVAQDACLDAGGSVISVVADELQDQSSCDRVLYLSEDSFDLMFSPQRALSRNRVIQALAGMTFVAQCSLETGGTWDGTVRNLRENWSSVYCFNDGSAAMEALEKRGAVLITQEQLSDFSALHRPIQLFI